MRLERFSKILVVNPYGIGDVLFMTPLIRQIKKSFPDAYLACLLGSRTKEILEMNPYVDEIFTFDKGLFDRSSFKNRIKILFPLLRKLRSKRFEVMIDISNAPEYSFLAKFFLGIKIRAGLDYKKRGRFLNRKIKLTGYEGKHVIEYYLDLIKLMGLEADDKKIDLYLTEEDEKFAAGFLKENGVAEGEKLFGIVPGGGKSWGDNAVYKQWPVEKFALVGDEVYRCYGLRTIIFGGPDELELTNRTRKLIKHECINSCAKTGIRQSAALMGMCELVLANDSGPLHIAVSRGVKTVSIFGPVDEKVYGPYPPSDKHKVLTAAVDCRPCYRRFKFNKCASQKCLFNISPEEVFKAIVEILC
ncbi:MAG: glycosyltransferase family 9 protein [Candidatus Omnitrophota bacterium]